jgi:hypothetical protein
MPSMTLDEFKTTLTDLPAGKAAHVPYEIFQDLFSPGVEDEQAKGQAYAFAKSCGCIIEHRADTREVLFVRPAT